MQTLFPGLVSVSFREHTPAEIIAAAAKNGLRGIEWGGDVHVPAGDLNTARSVGDATRAAGLEVAAYGSYYRLGLGHDFGDVLASAKALGAPVMRIWGYDRGSAEIDEKTFHALVEEARWVARRAAKEQITLCLECHHGTLTDDAAFSLRFLEAVGADNLRMYWQPNQYKSDAYNLEAARMLANVTVHCHVFHWDAQNRYPLAEGKEIWQQYLDVFRATGRPHGCLLEFMHDGRLESLSQTAHTLLDWLR